MSGLDRLDEIEARFRAAVCPEEGHEHETAAASARDVRPLVAGLRAARQVVTEAIEDADHAYADPARTNEGRARSDIVRRVLWTVRDDMDAAITAVLDAS